jgi:hypothetical protein
VLDQPVDPDRFCEIGLRSLRRSSEAGLDPKADKSITQSRVSILSIKRGHSFEELFWCSFATEEPTLMQQTTKGVPHRMS